MKENYGDEFYQFENTTSFRALMQIVKKNSEYIQRNMKPLCKLKKIER